MTNDMYKLVLIITGRAFSVTYYVSIMIHDIKLSSDYDSSAMYNRRLSLKLAYYLQDIIPKGVIGQGPYDLIGKRLEIIDICTQKKIKSFHLMHPIDDVQQDIMC